MIVALALVSWAFEAKHFPDFGVEQNRLFQAFAEALFPGALFWGAYMALEPWVRRHWPNGLIGWSRALGRGFKDPLVGRDVLVGVAFGAALASYSYAWKLGRLWITGEPPDPVLNQFSGLAGMRFLASDVGEDVTNALINGVFFILVYVVLRTAASGSASWPRPAWCWCSRCSWVAKARSAMTRRGWIWSRRSASP